MVIAPMSAATVPARRVANHAQLMKETLRSSRSRAQVPQSNPYVAQLAKDLLSRESAATRRGVEQVAALVSDLAHRGTLGDAQAVGYMYLAIAEYEYERTHPGETAAMLSEAEAHIAEERAEGQVEEAETVMARFPTTANRLDYLSKCAEHLRTIHQLNRAVRANVVKETQQT
jgi:hypothetical protein